MKKEQIAMVSKLAQIGIECQDIEVLLRLARRLNTWNERICCELREDDHGYWIVDKNGDNLYRAKDTGKSVNKKLDALRAKYPGVKFKTYQNPSSAPIVVNNEIYLY